MSRRHELHAYEYVNHGYETVRDALLADPLAVFRRATPLHAKAGPLDVAAEVELEILAIEAARSPNDHPATKLELAWKALHHPDLFPTMRATLSVYALTPTETQLDFAGTYDPPLGVVGDAMDAIAMRRIAEESVAGFVREVAAVLRATPG